MKAPIRLTKRRALALGGLIVLVVITVSVRAFVFPSQRIPESADAVVVYAGGQPGERIGRALELMEQGVASTLVVSEGDQTWAQGTEVQRLCLAGSGTFEVICGLASPNDTAGESRLFAQIAQERGWGDLVIVSSGPHLTRASLWLSRCSSVALSRVDSGGRSLANLGREWLKTVDALVVDRECPGSHGGSVSSVWNDETRFNPEDGSGFEAESDGQTTPETNAAPDATSGSPTERPDRRFPHDNRLSQCQDWVGRRLVMSVYSVPIDHPDTRTVDQLADDGFSHVGPWYGKDRWSSGKRAAELGLCTIFPVGPSISADLAINDVEGTIGQVLDDLHAALADPELNSSISVWAILPEELNLTQRRERDLLARIAETIRRTDPLERPIYMYLASNADAFQFEEASRQIDILGQGNYLSTNGLHNQRVYLKASILRSLEAREAIGQPTDSILPVVEHRIHSGTLDPALSPRIESWVRHDLFTTLANGSDGFLAFSGFPPKQGLEDFEAYNNAYATVVAEIISTDMLNLYRYARADTVITASVARGPAELSIETISQPGLVETFPSFSLRSWTLDGVRTILLVNHADEPLGVTLEGFEGSGVLELQDQLGGESFPLVAASVQVDLPRNGVVVLTPQLSGD